MSTNKWMSKLAKDVGKLASDIPSPTNNVTSLPSPSMNWVVGNGGISRGKALCLFGPESGGKSLLMQLVIIQLLRDNPEGMCVLFDAEYSFNPDWFRKLAGASGDPLEAFEVESLVERLIVRQTNDPLKIFDYIEGELQEMIQDGCPIVGLAIDSVKSIRYPKDIKEKSTKMVMGGGGASYLGSALKGVLPVIRENGITTILVQQVYEEMDEYKKMSNPYIVPDGRALKHFCDYMLEVTRIDTKAGRIEEGKNMYGGAQQVGHIVRVRGKKNRVGAPFRAGQFSLSYTGGIINVPQEVFELAKSLGVIYHPINPATGKVNVQMWKFGEHDPIRGEANTLEWVKGDADLQKEIMAACYTVDSTDVLEKRNEEFGYTGVASSMLE
jgi:RecA/RadA recombinase